MESRWKIPGTTISVGAAQGKTSSRRSQKSARLHASVGRGSNQQGGFVVGNIVLSEVDKVYENGFHAVHKLSLDVADGEFLVLVGPSGCGKSTALRMIAGLESITSGELRIGGKVVNDLEPKDRDIAMVFQSYALYPHLTVRDNIAFALKLTQDAQGRDQRARREGGEDPRAHREPRSRAGPAVGWPAPARGDGPRDRAPAAGVLDGRAAVEPRRQAARPDAGRGLQAPALAQRHHRLRDPRPDRGDDDGRSRRGAVPRRPAAGRHAAGPLRPPGQPVRRGVHRLAADEPARGDRVEQRRRHDAEAREQHPHRAGVGAGDAPVARRLRRAGGSRSASVPSTCRSRPTAPPTPSTASSKSARASAPRSSST